MPRDKYYKTASCSFRQDIGCGLIYCLEENGCEYSHKFGDNDYCLYKEITRENRIAAREAKKNLQTILA